MGRINLVKKQFMNVSNYKEFINLKLLPALKRTASEQPRKSHFVIKAT